MPCYVYQKMYVVRHYHILQKPQLIAVGAELPQVSLYNLPKRAFLYVHLGEDTCQLAKTRDAGSLGHGDMVYASGPVIVVEGS